jgi:kynurenine formamidase
MSSDQAAGGTARPGQISEADFRALYERLRARVPWGPADRRGALNYLTPATTLAAAGDVKLGRSVSMASPIEYSATADNPEPARHKMTQTGDSASDDGLSFAMDQIGMNIHGNADTHIDALSHVIYDGRLYNNRPADIVSDTGAAELSIGLAADGIVGRGVLLDVPRARRVPWLEPGDHVTADDLAAAERDQQVQVGEGDLVFVRVGHRFRRFQLGPWDSASARAGLHPAAMEYLSDRNIALLGSDGNNDTAPSAVPGVDFPVHVLAIAALGVYLIDYLDFSALAPVCAEFRQWSFLCVIAPLRLAVATGSPVNPIAIL